MENPFARSRWARSQRAFSPRRKRCAFLPHSKKCEAFREKNAPPSRQDLNTSGTRCFCWARSGMVNTSLSHSEDSRFDPGRAHTLKGMPVFFFIPLRVPPNLQHSFKLPVRPSTMKLLAGCCAAAQQRPRANPLMNGFGHAAGFSLPQWHGCLQALLFAV